MAAFFQKMDKLKPIYDWVYKITMILCKLLLIADVLITTMAVVGRYVPFVPDPAWSEEVVLTLMVYMAVLSASMALRRNAHIRMTALDNYLPKKVVQVLDILADIAVLAFAVVMIVEGWSYATGLGSKGFYTSLPKLSKFWMYFPVPLAGITMVIFELETLYNHVKVLVLKEGETK